jgi:hypothetical protein
MSLRLARPALLTDPDALAPALGSIARIDREPLTSAASFSGATFERLTVTRLDGTARSLVLKRACLAEDWLARLTGDTFGRAVVPLDAPALAGIWDVFANPYLAHAVGDGVAAMLMEDLSSHLLPDVREPLSDEAEGAMLGALARMHARFWDSPALAEPGLLQFTGLADMVGPDAPTRLAGRDDLGPVVERAITGWAVAKKHLPRGVADRLARPIAELEDEWRSLPRTLAHGDFKVANFAILPGGRVAAFDWGLIAAGPVAIDLGWSLAVNASRIRVDRDAYLGRYRGLLEQALGRTLPAPTWDALVRAAIDAGARTLLWSKALALEAGSPAARVEWEWWMERLGRR